MGVRWTEEDLARFERQKRENQERAVARREQPGVRVLAPPGMKKFKGTFIPNEESEHKRLVELLTNKRLQEECPEVKWIYHTPNGGKRSKATAGKLAAMGTLKGVPDVRWDLRRFGWRPGFAPWPIDYHGTVEVEMTPTHPQDEPCPSGGFYLMPGIAIELKAGDGALSSEQRDFLLWLASQGHATFVCWSALDAFNVLAWYGGWRCRAHVVGLNGDVQVIW